MRVQASCAMAAAIGFAVAAASAAMTCTGESTRVPQDADGDRDVCATWDESPAWPPCTVVDDEQGGWHGYCGSSHGGSEVSHGVLEVSEDVEDRHLILNLPGDFQALEPGQGGDPGSADLPGDFPQAGTLDPAPAPVARLAEEWECSQCGPTAHLRPGHGVQGDDPPADAEAADGAVNADEGTGASGEPAALLWESSLAQDDVGGEWDGSAEHRWTHPAACDAVWGDPVEHHTLRIEDLSAPFIQEEGSLYWLSVGVRIAREAAPERVGWQTSVARSGHDAVWLDPRGQGQHLRALYADKPPEGPFAIATFADIPGRVLLAVSAVGLAGLGGYLRKRRKTSSLPR